MNAIVVNFIVVNITAVCVAGFGVILLYFMR